MTIYQDDDKQRDSLGQAWHIGLSCATVGLGFWWGLSNFSQGNPFLGIITFCLMPRLPKMLKAPAYIIAGCHACGMQLVTERRGKAVMDARFKGMETENNEARNRAQQGQGKQEVIKRLGTLDSCLVTLDGETDRSKRVIMLQEAYSQVVALEAKLVSGELGKEVLSDPYVRDHAQATRQHLIRIGLTNDRLHQEIVRLFQLG